MSQVPGVLFILVNRSVVIRVLQARETEAPDLGPDLTSPATMFMGSSQVKWILDKPRTPPTPD